MKNKLLWGLQIFAAFAFIAAGGAKLAGVQQMIDIFEKIGLGQWFRIVTGLVEVTGGFLLLAPRFSGLGAALLACTMACATVTHLFVIGGNPAPAIVLLLITAGIASQRLKPQLYALHFTHA